MDQDLLNKAFVMVNGIGEDLLAISRESIARMEKEAEEKGDTALFEKAQEKKIKTNELEALCKKQRSDYPHLFDKEKK